jgi:hypothetical protein
MSTVTESAAVSKVKVALILGKLGSAEWEVAPADFGCPVAPPVKDESASCWACGVKVNKAGQLHGLFPTNLLN